MIIVQLIECLFGLKMVKCYGYIICIVICTYIYVVLAI